MPTENRSSNPEMASELLPCPFCGQQDFLIERLDSDASVVICQGLTGPHEACLARGPVGVAQNEGEEQPGRDKAVELWNARAEQHQGKPVAVLYANGTVLTKADCGNVFDICCKVETPLYTHADPGEVECLRVELGHMREERDDLSAKLDRFYSRTHGIKNLAAIEELSDKLAERDALLREADEFMYIMTGHDSHARLAHRYGEKWWDAIEKLRGKVCTALSATAAPEAKS
ncbi:Lar family restriction alleviation protein [Pseudomonas putida]|uniref:Lar family restriction alleviation protein n=1 Tax=Pseudomonas putida TaxID=303 RepID=A0A8I1ECF9_PSEPU|nr:Lar family restriction alleviation protein [Pseudomonas putida]MBI6883980.1 Lar family restriction alleviation protein [Pseudomonas putida]